MERSEIRESAGGAHGRAAAIVITYRQNSGRMSGLRGLKGCRLRAHLSQSEACRRIGISKPTWRQWEHLRHWPSAYQLPQIASALGSSIDELYLGPGCSAQEDQTEEDTT